MACSLQVLAERSVDVCVCVGGEYEANYRRYAMLLRFQDIRICSENSGIVEGHDRGLKVRQACQGAEGDGLIIFKAPVDGEGMLQGSKVAVARVQQWSAMDGTATPHALARQPQQDKKPVCAAGCVCNIRGRVKSCGHSQSRLGSTPRLALQGMWGALLHAAQAHTPPQIMLCSTPAVAFISHARVPLDVVAYCVTAVGPTRHPHSHALYHATLQPTPPHAQLIAASLQ